MSKSQELHSSGEAGEPGVYTIEMVERITHISRERIVLYHQHGLISSIRVERTEELFFDEDGIHKLRQIAFVLSEYGINQQGLVRFVSLMDEVERLREEVRFLRRKS